MIVFKDALLYQTMKLMKKTFYSIVFCLLISPNLWADQEIASRDSLKTKPKENQHLHGEHFHFAHKTKGNHYFHGGVVHFGKKTKGSSTFHGRDLHFAYKTKGKSSFS